MKSSTTTAADTSATPTPDPRRAAFDLPAAGVAAGLPVPRSIDVANGSLSGGDLTLYLADNDRTAVEQWASWLGLPAPEMTLHPMKTGQSSHPTGFFQPYESKTYNHPALGRAVMAKSYLTVPAPVVDGEPVEVTA